MALLATLVLTHSRGALISLTSPSRRRWHTAAGGNPALSLLCLPLLALIFSGRMTDFAALNEGTGQDRIQIWSDGLTVFRQYPFFGLGEGLFVDKYGVVTHNSFLHCYAELGILGGTAFLACFLAAALGLWSLRKEYRNPHAPDRIPRELRELAHLRVFVFAALAAYSAGMLTLSRQFVAPTYLILGLAAATTSLHGSPAHKWRLGGGFCPSRCWPARRFCWLFT